MRAGDQAFAAVLDEMLARSTAAEPEPAATPTIPLDLVGLLDEAVGAPSREVGDVAAEYLLSAVRDQMALEFEQVLDTVIVTEPPSIDPADIALELGLADANPECLDRLRREFAFANHPDRVDAAVRDRAMIRMQVANGLIDEAKRRTRG